jgi:hypothetical protein
VLLATWNHDSSNQFSLVLKWGGSKPATIKKTMVHDGSIYVSTFFMFQKSNTMTI